MTMIKTQGGAFQRLGTTTIGDFPYSNKNEVIDGTFNYTGKKKPSYQNGSFGVDSKHFIGSMDVDRGSNLASSKTFIGAHAAFSGQRTQEELSRLVQAVQDAKEDKDASQTHLQKWTKKYNEYASQYNHYLSLERKHQQDRDHCCGTCFGCKKRNREEYEQTKSLRIAAETKRNQAGLEVQKWNKINLTRQKALEAVEKSFSDYKIALEREKTKQGEFQANEAIERLRNESQQKAIGLKAKEVDASTNPEVIGAKLKQQEKKSQTTLLLAVIGAIVALVLAKTL